MRAYVITIVICLTVSITCTSQKQKNNYNIKSDFYKVTDTVEKDIPKSLIDRKQYLDRVALQLGVRSIEDTKDDLHLRLWIGHGYNDGDSSQLVIFQKTGDWVNGVLYTFIEPYSTEDSILNLSGKFETLKPRSGWNKFIEQLWALGISSLPNYSNLKNYTLASDSFGVVVEVKTKKIYRIYYYPDYDANIHIPEARKMYEITKFMNSEFHIDFMY